MSDQLEGAAKPEDARIDRLAGGGGKLVHNSAIMRYVAGAVRRERQRLSEIFADAGMHEIAQRISSDSNDDAVFRFRPPSVDLHAKTMEPREKDAADQFEVGG